MHVYIDESGDLGWTLDKPYRTSGSSQYLTIVLLLIPDALKDHPKRIIRKLYKKYKMPATREIKGAGLSDEQRIYFVEQVISLKTKHPEIKILSITVKKKNVQEHIRKDPNKLYNYMIRLALLDEISQDDSVTLFPDPRSIKVQSGNSLMDYLQTTLWFELNSLTILNQVLLESQNSLNLKFTDMLAHIIWCNHEDNRLHHSDLLAPYVKSKKLFF